MKRRRLTFTGAASAGRRWPSQRAKQSLGFTIYLCCMRAGYREVYRLDEDGGRPESSELRIWMRENAPKTAISQRAPRWLGCRPYHAPPRGKFERNRSSK